MWLWRGKSEDFSDIKFPATSDNSINPRLDYFSNPIFRVDLIGAFLKPVRINFAPEKIKHLYITFEIKSWSYFIGNCGLLR